MNLKSVASKILVNRYVLNIVLLLAILMVAGFVLMGDINSLALFVLMALLIVNFNKNMIVVLGIPMIMTSLFYVFNKKRREGMENNEKDEEDKKPEAKEKIEETKEKVADVVKSGNMTMTAVNSDTKIGNDKNNDVKTDESFEVGRNKKGQYNIDYASTIEDAYDELNKILGSDGIKNLTDDTQKLMKQQMMLAESMQSMEPIIKGMGPLLEKAQGLLGNMGDNNGNLGSIQKLAEKFTNKGG